VGAKESSVVSINYSNHFQFTQVVGVFPGPPRCLARKRAVFSMDFCANFSSLVSAMAEGAKFYSVDVRWFGRLKHLHAFSK
jgi:hypothetical protein